MESYSASPFSGVKRSRQSHCHLALLAIAVVTLANVLGGCAGLPTALPEGPFRVTVQSSEGRVLIVRERVYVEAQAGTELQPGDRVATFENANASLRYVALDAEGKETEEHCVVTVPANSVLEIVNGEDCAQPTLAAVDEEGNGA